MYVPVVNQTDSNSAIYSLHRISNSWVRIVLLPNGNALATATSELEINRLTTHLLVQCIPQQSVRTVCITYSIVLDSRAGGGR